MGRRSKKEIHTVRVDTDNPLLKRLEQLSQHRRNVANGSEKLSVEEERDLVEQKKRAIEWKKSFDSIKDNRFFKRGKWMDDIAVATNTSGIDVSKMFGDFWGFPLLSDEELEQAARDANKIYQEVETDLNFDSKLSREQIETLLPIMNEFVFAEAQSVDDVQRLLECKQEKPVKVKSNALISYLFGELSRNEWICQNWQKVAESKLCFLSRRGNVLTQKTLSNALTKCYARGLFPSNILNQDIFDAITRLKR